MQVFDQTIKTSTVENAGQTTDTSIPYLVNPYTSMDSLTKTNFLVFVNDGSNNNLVDGKVQPVIVPPPINVLQDGVEQRLVTTDDQSVLINGDLRYYNQGNLLWQIGQNYKLMVEGLSSSGNKGIELQLWDQETTHNYDQVKASYFIPNTTTAEQEAAQVTFQTHTIIQWGNRLETRYVDGFRRVVGHVVHHTEGNEVSRVTDKTTMNQYSGQNVTVITGANIEMYVGIKNLTNTGFVWNLFPLAPTVIVHLYLAIFQVVGTGASLIKAKFDMLRVRGAIVSVGAFAARCGSTALNCIGGLRIGIPRL